MKKTVFLSFCFFVCIISPKAQSNDANMSAQIHNLVGVVDSAQYGIAFKDLKTGKSFFINEHGSFHAASTMKVPVMVAAFDQIRRRTFSLQDSIVVHDHFKSIADGSDYSLSPKGR